MKVHWTENAIKHLTAIHEYIAQTRRSEQIATFPLSGRMVPEYDTEDIREVIEKPYRVIYRIKMEQIEVIAVMHSSQILG